MLFPALPFLLISILHVLGEVANSRMIRHGTKPLLMPLLAFFYILTEFNFSFLFIAALAGGWVGDLFLMLPDKGNKKTWFKLGLISFLVGHLFYVMAFFKKGSLSALFSPAFIPAMGFLLFGFLVFLGMKNFMGKLFGPITVYIAVIALMGVSTTLCFGIQPRNAVWISLLGALIFMISDTMNAWNRFVKVIPHERVLTMTSYLAGQFFLVLGYVQFTA
ncbi:lysoplasmalogenase [Oceanispirochaeta crateris]|uniref:Lysoplasmalogenase n=1 Tax=Oceanispirochaeta crateris TaxID=2518645 RepID=A0A5C1QKP4_9SPIO|nr:lysoplasmalogenase [Oceanispirochaeta crateris]QEN08725.1 lysoplasmalogenase [Oceanispirochaeta crateris]